MHQARQEGYPVGLSCKTLGLSRSGYYAWDKRPAQLITEDTLMLYRTAKQLFKDSRESLGSRELMKKLNQHGFAIGRYKTRSIMQRLNLVVRQRVAYKVTTQRDKRHLAAPNLVSMDFNPERPNQVWAGDITYLKTAQGWMYLSVVMDLYSRRIVGWSISKRMTTDLVLKSLQQAYWLRKHPKGVIFHSDRGSQYTSKKLRKALVRMGIKQSMGDTGACWDNAVVERFFGSLKHDWILKVHHATYEEMVADVTAYMKYYNVKRLHTANGDVSPVEYENYQLKVSTWT
ncbi:transposase (plasmid) [Klebsiella pneumoniae]|nr:transposase [Klebsiella pneumoniae]AOT67838.1 transposase [Klebsiella pneumoniae]AOT67850.1 transposase [Klebsiella pneumoniae]AOT67924.1 transposase [Klebsiella pneumoniae]AOT67928.1 transposase [Klebsiella pneumoniae]